MRPAPCPAAGPPMRISLSTALADGGVKCGLPRSKAIRYAAQMLRGSAALVLQSGKHPELLKDEVCSPGGSTIAGVAALEDRGFRGACIAAVEAGLQAHEGTWLKNGSNKNRGAGNSPGCRDFLCNFIRYEPPASTGALQSR